MSEYGLAEWGWRRRREALLSPAPGWRSGAGGSLRGSYISLLLPEYHILLLDILRLALFA